MSGASALAAAKRRRSKVDSSRTPSSTSTSSSNRSNNNSSSSGSSSNGMPSRLTTQQSFQYMWQKILQVESMVNNNTTIMKNTPSSSSNNNSFEVNELRQKVAILEGSLNKLSTTGNKTVEVDGEKFVSVEQFNDVMNKVALDMQNISEKVTQLSDFVSNVQNNNVILRNMLDSIQPSNFGFDDNSSAGLSIGSESMIESVVVEENDDGDNGSEDNVNDDNNDVSAAPDVTSVLEKLKTLNSEEIKEEVKAELNNNITLVVEESNGSSSESSK